MLLSLARNSTLTLFAQPHQGSLSGDEREWGLGFIFADRTKLYMFIKI